jgi:dihydrofolate synthase/folylpolyglutamate synthase
MRVAMGRYGEVTLPMLGRYEIENAGLAVWAAGNIHARLNSPIKHATAEYVNRIRDGLGSVQWPGRCQKLEDHPAVYVDGAINTLSARLYIESVRDRLTRPTVTVLAVPTDRDVEGVYSLFAPISDALILTQTGRNITIHFPEPQDALATARRFHDDVSYADTIPAALELAKQRAGADGAVLMALAQPAIGDLMAHYGLTFEQI